MDGPITLYEPVLLGGEDETIVYQAGAFPTEAEAQKVLEIWRAEGRQQSMEINYVTFYNTAEEWQNDR